MTNTIDLRRIFLISLIASVATSAIIGIGVLLLGNFGLIEVRVLMTTMAVGSRVPPSRTARLCHAGLWLRAERSERYVLQ